MAGRGAPFGNQNATKAKRWTAAIERAIVRRAGQSGKEFAEALDELADKFVDAVVSGDKDCLPGYKELGDRLEGKAVQAIEASGPDGEPLSGIFRIEWGKDSQAPAETPVPDPAKPL